MGADRAFSEPTQHKKMTLFHGDVWIFFEEWICAPLEAGEWSDLNTDRKPHRSKRVGESITLFCPSGHKALMPNNGYSFPHYHQWSRYGLECGENADLDFHRRNKRHPKMKYLLAIVLYSLPDGRHHCQYVVSFSHLSAGKAQPQVRKLVSNHEETGPGNCSLEIENVPLGSLSRH